MKRHEGTRRGYGRIGGRSVTSRTVVTRIEGGARVRLGVVRETVHSSRVGTIGSGGRRSWRGGTGRLLKGRPPTCETRIADSAIWGIGIGLTMGTESKWRIGTEIVWHVVSTMWNKFMM